jgi:hypothetical protein
MNARQFRKLFAYYRANPEALEILMWLYPEHREWGRPLYEQLIEELTNHWIATDPDGWYAYMTNTKVYTGLLDYMNKKITDGMGLPNAIVTGSPTRAADELKERALRAHEGDTIFKTIRPESKHWKWPEEEDR